MLSGSPNTAGASESGSLAITASYSYMLSVQGSLTPRIISLPLPLPLVNCETVSASVHDALQ
jgi:hypothetical protein